MKICIDPGHGGKDPGAVGKNPYTLKEATVNLDIALFLKEFIENSNYKYPVFLTREKDEFVGLSKRARFANRKGCGLFISIHCNAAESPTAEGMEIFHYPNSKQGLILAQHIWRYMRNYFPMHKARGIKTGNFTVLKKTKMPATLIECEFLTNMRQLRFLGNRENLHTFAMAITQGIDKYIEEI